MRSPKLDNIPLEKVAAIFLRRFPVWTQLEPVPLVVADPLPIVIGIVLFGVGHAFVYRWLSAAWPEGVVQRALRFAGLLFFMTFAFWEFFTPFNQFGEPLPLRSKGNAKR